MSRLLYRPSSSISSGPLPRSAASPLVSPSSVQSDTTSRPFCIRVLTNCLSVKLGFCRNRRSTGFASSVTHPQQAHLPSEYLLDLPAVLSGLLYPPPLLLRTPLPPHSGTRSCSVIYVILPSSRVLSEHFPLFPTLSRFNYLLLIIIIIIYVCIMVATLVCA